MFELFCLLPFLLTVGGQQECQSRDYGNGGTVCVCTAQYCDTIPRPEKVDPSQYLIYTSDQTGLRFNQTTGTFSSTYFIAADSVFINSSIQFQTILGWGGAFTDATGINIASLDEQTQQHLLNSYFSDQGIEYNLCRVPMGGTDFSTHAYSYDDGPVDEDLVNFQLAPEDFQYKIPYILQAQNLTGGNLNLFTSTWTAPKWMKSNGKYNGLGFIIVNMFQVWADYFLKFLDQYQAQGVEFWGITTGNEPSKANLVGEQGSSVGWTNTEMVLWITNNLGPTLRNSSHSDIKIMMLDDQRFLLPEAPSSILQDDMARQYVDGIAVHWYYDDYYYNGSLAFPPSLLTETHDNFPEKFILGTEASNGGSVDEEPVLLGSWSRGAAYSADIIQDINNWVAGWVDWNMVLDVAGGPTYINNPVDSPIIVNASAGEFYKQPMYYHMGHFSKFVPRGSVRMRSNSGDRGVPIATFLRPDNGTVVVLLNLYEELEVPVTIYDNENIRGYANFFLSPNSITTVLYW